MVDQGKVTYIMDLYNKYPSFGFSGMNLALSSKLRRTNHCLYLCAKRGNIFVTGIVPTEGFLHTNFIYNKRETKVNF